MKNLYTIRDLENLSGIKAHTLRIWEKRYQVLVPKRSETNIRYYDLEDLKKILNIKILYTEGLKISEIAVLNEEQIIVKADELLQKNSNSTSKEFDFIIQSIIELDTDAIETTLEVLYQGMGMIELHVQIINPILIRIGELWQLNTINISHEHLFSNALRKLILSKTNNIVPLHPLKKKVILFLLPNEHHELPILFYQYILKSYGWNCIYLGENVPIRDFELAYIQIKPDFVLTSIISVVDYKTFSTRLTSLLEIIPMNKLCLTGSAAIEHSSQIPERIHVVQNLNDFKEIFKIKQ